MREQFALVILGGLGLTSLIHNPLVIIIAVLVLAAIILGAGLWLFRSTGKKKKEQAGAGSAPNWQAQGQQANPPAWNQQGGAADNQWAQQANAPAWGQQPGAADNQWAQQPNAPAWAQQPGAADNQWGQQAGQSAWNAPGFGQQAQQQPAQWNAPAPAQQPSAWPAPATGQQGNAWGNPSQPQTGGSVNQPAAWNAPSSAQQAPSAWGASGAPAVNTGGQADSWAKAQPQAAASPQQGGAQWGGVPGNAAAQQGNVQQSAGAFGAASAQSWPPVAPAAPNADPWAAPVGQPAQSGPGPQVGWPQPQSFQPPVSSTPPGAAPTAFPAWNQPAYGGQPYGGNDNDKTLLRNSSPQLSTGVVRVEEGKEPGRVYEIRKDSLSIGRSRESDIFLEDLAVSRFHASIVSQGNGNYALKDEGSANGTKVNGRLVNKYETMTLQEGDKIQLGQTVLVFARR